MIKSSLFVALVVVVVGCGGESVRDGSQGPTSSSHTRISSNAYHTEVSIEAVKRFNTEGVAVDIALSEDAHVAYIASGFGGLEVIDVSNPENPHLISSYDLPEYVNYVEVEDGKVYVAYIPTGLESYYQVHAFDIDNPYHPNYIGSVKGQSGVGHSSGALGEYDYEVNEEGLEIFRGFQKVGSYYLHDSAYALALHSNYVFIANGREGLTILKTDIGAREVTIH